MVDYLTKDGFIVSSASGAYSPGARAYSMSDRKLKSAIIARSEGPMRRYVARYEQIGAAGLSFGEVLCVTGVYVVAVPVPIGDNACAAIVTSPYMLKQKDDESLREDLVAELRHCATEISAQF